MMPHLLVNQLRDVTSGYERIQKFICDDAYLPIVYDLCVQNSLA